MYKETFVQYFLLLWMATFLVSCASSGTLSGGEKDVQGPILLKEKSSPSLVTNYQGEKIEMEFDEFVVLTNTSDVIISPPLNYNPNIDIRGRKLTFEFSDKEELKEDVTYVIDFSQALKDFTEGNKTDSTNYVFSTGDKIYTIKMKGSITNPDPKYDLEGKLVMLYANDYDSITVKEKPLYYVKTDEEGNFRFSNLKEGSYKILGLEDNNANYFNDLSTESVAFSDTPIILSDTAKMQDITLEMFYPETPIKIVTIDEKRYGQISLEFNQDAIDVVISPIEEAFEFIRIDEKEKVELWYTDTIDRVSILVLGDTLDLKLPSLDTAYTLKKYKVEGYNQKLSPEDSLVVQFSSPIGFYKDSLITLIDDHQEEIAHSIRVEGREMIFKWSNKAGPYILNMDSTAVVNIYNQSIDSTSLSINRVAPDKLLDVEVEIEKLDSLSQYLISLMLKDKIISKKVVEGTTTGRFSFPGLLSDSYTLSIIEDANRDGEWTVGDYWARRRPEKKKSINITVMTEKDREQSFDWKTGEPSKSKPNTGKGIEETEVKSK